MKILFISDVYFPRVNGVSTSIETFRHELGLLGHKVHLIAPDYPATGAAEDGILRVPSRQLPFDPEDRLMNYGWAMAHLEKLREEHYDLIHIQTPFVAHYLGTKLSRALSVPCIETYHTFFEEYLHHYIPLAPRAMLRATARLFSRHQCNCLHGMVAPSQPMMSVLRGYGIKTFAQVIPTGLEPESFTTGNRKAFRDKYAIAQGRPLLLFVGRVAHEKNIHFLLQITLQVKKTLPDILLVIAGAGPARKNLQLEALNAGLSGNVLFIGYLDRHTELNSCYRSADIFVFSSKTETQGLVLLEAMAQGVPVVSIAEMGTKEVLREGCGVWIALEQVQDFSDKVLRLLADSQARANLGLEALKYASGWSAGKMAERMLTFYAQVIEAYRP